jgi:hypothetical protein
MEMIQYLELCRLTSMLLNLQDVTALGMGDVVKVDEVEIQSVYMDKFPGVLLLAEMGKAAEYDKAGVYEQLLTLQLLHWSEREIRFGFHPGRESVVLSLMLEPGDGATPEKFADLIETAAAQVTQWKQDLLARRLFPADGEGAFFMDPFGVTGGTSFEGAIA